MNATFTRSISAVALLSVIAPGFANAEEVLVGKVVPTAQRVSLDAIDHEAWDALLRRFVDDRGQVDYRSWKADPAAVSELDGYLNLLSTGDADGAASREAKLAFWINAYNAVTVKGILREYPTTSIRNHTAKLWGYNIWKNLLLQVDGKKPSLEDIEHKTLRLMNEPRIHFAIVCASKGCPRLLNEAYTAERLEEQLELNARDFFAQQQNFQAEAAAKQVRLSAILQWFGEDFGDNEQEVLSRISVWLPNDDARRVVADRSVRVSYLDYDWDINEQAN